MTNEKWIPKAPTLTEEEITKYQDIKDYSHAYYLRRLRAKMSARQNLNIKPQNNTDSFGGNESPFIYHNELNDEDDLTYFSNVVIYYSMVKRRKIKLKLSSKRRLKKRAILKRKAKDDLGNNTH